MAHQFAMESWPAHNWLPENTWRSVKALLQPHEDASPIGRLHAFCLPLSDGYPGEERVDNHA
jgi:hypothetical protein